MNLIKKPAYPHGLAGKNVSTYSQNHNIQTFIFHLRSKPFPPSLRMSAY